MDTDFYLQIRQILNSHRQDGLGEMIVFFPVILQKYESDAILKWYWSFSSFKVDRDKGTNIPLKF